MRETWLDSWVGKVPWRTDRLPTPVFWPGEFHKLYSPWGCKESDATEWLSLHWLSLNRGEIQVLRGLSEPGFFFNFAFYFIYFLLFFILPFRTWDYWPGCWPGIELSFKVVPLQQIILLPTVWNFLPPSLPLEIPFLLHGPSQKISRSKNPLFIPSLMSLFEPLQYLEALLWQTHRFWDQKNHSHNSLSNLIIICVLAIQIY